ncbi:MAG: anhydro-N-acetylmuramic acid kinase [Candidatus Neomarinimicrobiota bacterium]
MPVKIETVQKLNKKRPLRMAGLMSGTSMDGLDICVADVGFQGDSAEFVIKAAGSFPFPGSLRKAIRQSLTGSAEQVCRTHYDLGRFYEEKTVLFLRDSSLGEIDAVGMHGQTVYHISGEATLQVGEPSFLAEQLGIPVVSDFRARDISVGGTGAPLIPIIDKWIFQKDHERVVCLNLGGIANLSVVPPRIAGELVGGFDTGPGMALLDEAIYELSGKRADDDGKLASKGIPDEESLKRWMEDQFVNRIPPKSTGRDYFGSEWLHGRIKNMREWRLEHLLATLSLFTARSVAVNCQRFVDLSGARTLIVSGGGVHHSAVMKMLSQELPTLNVISSQAFGVDPDVKEALGMAILGAAYFKEIPGNIPSVTGAGREVVLGKLTL